MTTSGTAKLTLPSDTEILVVREFAAPRHLVYKAWTTPELVRRWWAGRRGQMDVAEIDLRVGGAWRYAMTATGGYEVAFHGEFREIVPNERLVYTEIYEGAPEGGAALNLITFTEEAGRTTVEMLTRVDSKQVRDLIIDSGMEGGMQEGMDLLEEVAVSLASESG
jgi:uncharacterized protein YndB with AHSA1/START domain